MWVSNKDYRCLLCYLVREEYVVIGQEKVNRQIRNRNWNSSVHVVVALGCRKSNPLATLRCQVGDFFRSAQVDPSTC